MRKVYLCLALLVGLAFCTSAWALTPIHEAQYLWHYNSGTGAYGTSVDQTYPTDRSWTIGDTSGETIAELREKVWDMEEDGKGLFTWSLWNDDLNNTLIPDYGIGSLVISSGGYEPLEWSAPDDWNFAFGGDYYVWWTTDTDAMVTPLGGSLGGFSVVVPTTMWTISNGAVDYKIFDELTGEIVDVAILDGDGYWRVSHPEVPEPTSMLLLGVGLIGLAGGKARKRFKA